MAFALGHIVGFHGHITGHAVIQLGIDVRAGHGCPGGPADVVHRHRAGGTHGHRVRTGQTGCQGHALQVMLTGRGHSHALLRIAHRLGLLAPGLQGTFSHSAFHIARDGIVADAHAEPCIAGRTAHRPGIVGQIFLPAGQYADVTAAGQGAARHSSLHIVANLVHGDVSRKSYLAGQSCAHTNGRNGGIPVCLHGGMLVFDRAAAHGGRSILIDAVDGYAGAAGKGATACAYHSRTVDLAVARCLYAHNSSLVFILVDGAVLDFGQNSLVDERRRRCALHGHLASAADAHANCRQGGVIRGLHGHRAILDIGQRGGDECRTRLLLGILCAGRSAAHIVVGYGTAQGHLAAGTDIAGNSHPHIVAFGFHFHSFGIGHCSIFYRIGPVFRAHFPYCGFRVTAAMVHHHGTVHGCILAGGHSSPDAINLARILAFHIHAHTGGRRFRCHAASGQVGTDVVVQAIVGQGGPDACRLAVGHGTGHVHSL